MNVYDVKIRKKIDYLTRWHVVTAHESPLPAMDPSHGPEPLSFLDYWNKFYKKNINKEAMLVLLVRDISAEPCLALSLVHGCLLSSPDVACSPWTRGLPNFVFSSACGGSMSRGVAVAADVGAASGCGAPSCDCWQHMHLGPDLGLNGLTWPLLCITFLVCCDVWCYPAIGRLAWKSDEGWLRQWPWMMNLGSEDWCVLDEFEGY
jgi:hypothetical protein